MDSLRTAIGLVLVAASSVQAQTTYYVNATCGSDSWTGRSPVCADPDGPKRSIKAGIGATVDGDTVIVADGVYAGLSNAGITFGGRRIVLRSENGPEGCIIDQLNMFRAFFMADNLTSETVIEGFTIRNGAGNPGGAFWFHHQNNPTVRNCIITGNHSTFMGGAIHTETDSRPTFIGCTIVGNTAPRGGAFSIAQASRPMIVNCVIAGNAAAEEGGALYVVNNPLPTIVNSTFVANSAGNRAGAVRVVGGTASVRNCVLWGNTAPAGAQAAVGLAGGAPSILLVSRSIVESGQAGVLVENPGMLGWLAGNLESDPRFVHPTAGNYRLLPDSPAIDAADNTALPPEVVTDRDGAPRFVDDPATPNTGIPGGAGGNAVVDAGAYEFQTDFCYADCTGEGLLSVADFTCFQGAFVAQAPYADCDQSGGSTVADFTCFQGAFVGGCP